MRVLVPFVIVLLLLPQNLIGSACCAGRGPKTFISLAELQTYELGLSVSNYRVFGRHNMYGEPEETDHNQLYTLSLGAGVRLLPSIEISAVIPFSYHEMGFGSARVHNTQVGDIVIGGRTTIVRSLFRDDWYPTIAVHAGLKVPTGSIEKFEASKFSPGTGNGLWEPFVGIGMKKEYGMVTLSFDATYTQRVGRIATFKEGNKFELSEMAAFPFSRRFSVGLGSTQSWVMRGSLGGGPVADTEGRAVSAIASSTYFLTEFWSIAAAFESGIALHGLGVNQQLAQSISLTTKYGFF